MPKFTITRTTLPDTISPQSHRQSRWSDVYDAMIADPGEWLLVEGLTSKEASSLQNSIRQHRDVEGKRVKRLAGFKAECATHRPHGKPVEVYVRVTPTPTKLVDVDLPS